MVWARKAKRMLKNMDQNDALKLRSELREHRKEIEKLDSDVFGTCIPCEALRTSKHVGGG